MKTKNLILSSKIIKFFNEKFDLQLRLHQKKTRIVKDEVKQKHLPCGLQTKETKLKKYLFQKRLQTHYRIKKTKGRMKSLRCMIYFHNTQSLNRGQPTSTCC